ncbi:MAG: sulfur-carrier protein [Tepidanaerobacteraceae bacterium]|nr:sulfur-carrier protein [Tepidanaerobacteraceae bacterium]
MKVKFFGNIRDITGTKEIQINGAASLRQLLQQLCDKYGKTFNEKVYKDNNITGEVIILVNGRNVYFTGGIETALSKDDEVSIFPIVAGG